MSSSVVLRFEAGARSLLVDAARRVATTDRPSAGYEGVSVRSVTAIKADLDRAAERRAELWRQLGQGADADIRAELGALSTEIDALWDELRTVQVRERFGDPEPILRRAERDKRLERDLDRIAELSRGVRRAA
jgi:hypothetical protein